MSWTVNLGIRLLLSKQPGQTSLFAALECSLRRGWGYKNEYQKCWHFSSKSENTPKPGTKAEESTELLGGGGEVRQQLSAHRDVEEELSSSSSTY